MVRGLFTNKSVRNLLDPRLAPGTAVHAPSGDILPLWLAAERYRQDGASSVIVAGERYGMGSSRDWAAKGIALLSVRAVLATSFERIHRSNLIGMGILPLRLPPEWTPERLALKPGDLIEIAAGADQIQPRCVVAVTIRRHVADPATKHNVADPATSLHDDAVLSFDAAAAIETALEVDVLKSGGMLPMIARRALSRRAQDFFG
jgi:aconitate hydratase